MTIAITGPSETPPSDQPDALQQNGVQAQGQASDTMVPITEAELVLGTAAAAGVRRKERRWVALYWDGSSWRRRNHARRGVLTDPARRIWTGREWHARWSDCESFGDCVGARTDAVTAMICVER
jgi:hypothetical protein